MRPAFTLPVRIYYEDTDAGGVVYYANYLKFMERARTEWLRALGFEQDELRRRERVVFAVQSVNIEFQKPARFNEMLTVTLGVKKRGGASIVFAQEIKRESTLLCRAEIKVACLDESSFAPRAWPDALGARLAQSETPA